MTYQQNSKIIRRFNIENYKRMYRQNLDSRKIITKSDLENFKRKQKEALDKTKNKTIMKLSKIHIHLINFIFKSLKEEPENWDSWDKGTKCDYNKKYGEYKFKIRFNITNVTIRVSYYVNKFQDKSYEIKILFLNPLFWRLLKSIKTVSKRQKLKEEYNSIKTQIDCLPEKERLNYIRENKLERIVNESK